MYRTIKYQDEYTNSWGINLYKQLYSSGEATKRIPNVVDVKCGTSQSKRDHRNRPGIPSSNEGESCGQHLARQGTDVRSVGHKIPLLAED